MAQAEDKRLGLARTSVLPRHDPRGTGIYRRVFPVLVPLGRGGTGEGEGQGHCPRAMVPPGWNLPGPEAKPSGTTELLRPPPIPVLTPHLLESSPGGVTAGGGGAAH